MANVGSTDKTLRLAAGVILIALAYFALGFLSTTTGIVALVAGVVLFATGVINFCPIYKIFGMRTNKSA